MMWDKLFSSVDLLQTGLSAAWTRNAVIRNNLANVETPGFKASEVEFESVFASAIDAAVDAGGFKGKRTREKHIEIGGIPDTDLSPRIVAAREGSMLMNGNNVDPEAENVKLAQNSILYNTMLSKMNSELTRIKLAISEGK